MVCVVVDVSGGMAEIQELNLFGCCATSPNGRYTLVWTDADPTGCRGGYRDSGHGRYVLVEDQRVVVQGQLERPNDGHVADNGTFILADWLFGGGLKGVFCAFSNRGQRLLEHHFKANIYSCGLSVDGSYAACQLCNSPDNYGGTIVLFNVLRRELVVQFRPVSAWPTKYLFDVGTSRIGLASNDGFTVWYTFAGDLVDRAAWENSRILHGSGFEVLQILRERYAAADRPLERRVAKDMIALATVAAERLSRWPREAARARRLGGEIAEAGDDLAGAIQQYELALILDARCGVRKRVTALRAQLGT